MCAGDVSSTYSIPGWTCMRALLLVRPGRIADQQPSARNARAHGVRGLGKVGWRRTMAASDVKPNFLFFLPDQHRFDWVPWNEDLPVRMPTLAGLAERGVRFSRAITPSPLCAPARACLASGKAY